MTAANEKEFQETNRRLSGLLAFLTVFLFAVTVLALSSRFHWLGTGQSSTFFDSKGILTGPGTLIVLIGAALSALIVFVSYKKWTLRRAFENPPAKPKGDENAARALGEWLQKDVLASAQIYDGNRIEGIFNGRRVAIERFESGGESRVRYSAETAESLSLRVWWLGKTRAEPAGGQSAAEFATNDPHFENCCGWQSPAPRDALQILNRGDVTGTLHRICFISGRSGGAPDDTGIAFENGRIVCATLAPSFAFMSAPSALVFLHDLVFLADAAENKTARQLLAGTEAAAQDGSGERYLEMLGKRRSRFMDLVSCLMFIVFVLVPLAALWIGGSYYCAKALDMSAGMLCFFVPVLLMAIFVFTRPTAPPAGSEGVNDMETVRAAALKFWEQRLRANPGYAGLLDKYEQRLEKT